MRSVINNKRMKMTCAKLLRQLHLCSQELRGLKTPVVEMRVCIRI